MNVLEIAGIIFGGLTVIGGAIGWFLRKIGEKNTEIKEKDEIIDSYTNEKINGIEEMEKKFNNHVKENSYMEQKVAVLEEKVGNIGVNLDEFKQETKHNFEAVFYKIDKIFENLNGMTKEVSAMMEAVKSLRNGKQ